VLAIMIVAPLVVRWREGSGRGAPHAGRGLQAAAVVVSRDRVVADLDLSGFVPVRRPRLTRADEVVSDLDLGGFVPVRSLTLRRESGAGGLP
jgi:hypothetical protein